MKSIDEITGAFGFPKGTWDGASDCLESIKQDPLSFREKGLLDPEILTAYFDPALLLSQQIYVQPSDKEIQLHSSDKFLAFEGKFVQMEPDSEGWYFGHAKAEILTGTAHGYDNAAIDFIPHTSGDVHDHAIGYGFEDVHIKAYDDSHVRFCKSGTLALYDRSTAQIKDDRAIVTAHDQTRVIANEACRIFAKGQSFVEAHSNCRIELEEQSACVAYDTCLFQAKDQSHIWLMQEGCHPLQVTAEATLCRAYESPVFRQAIHEALLSDRNVPDLINRLTDLTVAYGPAIHEDWEHGIEAIWMAQARIDLEERTFINLPKERSAHREIQPAVDRCGQLELQIPIVDAHSPSNIPLTQRIIERGYPLLFNAKTGTYAAFKHWGNAKQFSETLQYETAILHKLRPIIPLQETEAPLINQTNHRGYQL